MIGAEGKIIYTYLDPELWEYSLRHITSPKRGPFVLKKEDADFRILDVGNHRLYVAIFEPEQLPGHMFTWAASGCGLSIRCAEDLLKDVDNMKEVDFEDVEDPPPPTFTPETEHHFNLKHRIDELVHHAAIDPDSVQSSPKDVFLYPTGMAAIYRTSSTILDYRPGTIVILGIIFNNTFTFLQEECPQGSKHFGRTDDETLDQLETWLEEEKKAERPVSYLFVEFPGNPLVDSVDLVRLKKLVSIYFSSGLCKTDTYIFHLSE